MEQTRNYIGRWIGCTYRCGQIYFAKELSHLNIGSGQFFILALLYHQEGLTQEEISARLYVDKGTTAKAIKILEKEGYLYRVRDDADRRAYHVYLSPKALSIKEEFISILKKWTDILADGLTDEERIQAVSLLERITQNAVNYTKN